MRGIKFRKYFLTLKESRDIIDRSLSEIPEMERVFQRRKVSLQVLEVPFKDSIAKIYYLESDPVLVGLPDGRLLPFLTAVEKFNLPLPRVVVDLGAVKPVASGADVMGPGVKGVEGEFNEGDLVAVVDEKFKAVIAVGVALRSSAEARERGKTIKNIHHAGDLLWRAVSLK
ncbi:MAG: RNA-binding protein [Candidatus Korarchaeum sp.]|nr:RNA-binding protein [Candidatus Korarchaeum sp.]MDW8035002.1 PUA domain-containing protein [Candidatus Korarchaeum sp.]